MKCTMQKQSVVSSIMKTKHDSVMKGLTEQTDLLLTDLWRLTVQGYYKKIFIDKLYSMCFTVTILPAMVEPSARETAGSLTIIRTWISPTKIWTTYRSHILMIFLISKIVSLYRRYLCDSGRRSIQKSHCLGSLLRSWSSACRDGYLGLIDRQSLIATTAPVLSMPPTETGSWNSDCAAARGTGCRTLRSTCYNRRMCRYVKCTGRSALMSLLNVTHIAGSRGVFGRIHCI